MSKSDQIRPAANSAWIDALRLELRRAGYLDSMALAEQYPLEYFVDLARCVSPRVTAVSLYRLMRFEAEQQGLLREFAVSSLVRVLRRNFPSGWNVGDKPDWQRAKSYAKWLDILDRPKNREEGREAWEYIQTTAPVGWLPNSGEDPILQQAFEGLFQQQHPA